MTHTDQLRRALRLYDLAGPETPERAAALAAVLSAAHGVCACTCTYCAGTGKADGRECICQVIGLPPEPTLEGWPGSPAPDLPTPLQIEVANLRRQLRDTQDDLQRARYSPAERWT